jgi:hypothetical protein
MPTMNPAGRHSPRILGPTNVLDRVPHAIDRPTVDQSLDFGTVGAGMLAKLRRPRAAEGSAI